ncbi:MAG TPA: YciI family protein [Candidatus Saccharimonadales bacterium]|nr:YciI family protein [Candidatus Saccharimonadales bacterium]
MKKFIILYNGPATPMEDIPPEKREDIMDAWKVWMDRIEDGLVDAGQPMVDGRAVVDDGSQGTALQLNGYSIIQADDMNGAIDLVKDHPFLADKTGKFSVQVYELAPMPMQ